MLSIFLNYNTWIYLNITKAVLLFRFYVVRKVSDMLVFLLFSGQRPDNPLLLLGQYSDDELEDDLDGKLDNSTAENSVVEHNDEVINTFD